jgi:hypothetical protein
MILIYRVIVFGKLCGAGYEPASFNLFAQESIGIGIAAILTSLQYPRLRPGLLYSILTGEAYRHRKPTEQKVVESRDLLHRCTRKRFV